MALTNVESAQFLCDVSMGVTDNATTMQCPRRLLPVSLLVISILSAPILSMPMLAAPELQAQEWPQWRGPKGNNHAAAGATAPISWSNESNLAWLAPVPGHGHSSPTVVGERLYLTTADKQQQTQSLLIYNRLNGEKLAERLIHQDGLTGKLHPNNSFATATVASDGRYLFALFCNNGAAWVTALDLDGNQIWQKRALGFEPEKYQFGFGSSPVVIQGNVIVSSEYDGAESGIVALDAATGKLKWKRDRPKSLSYSTPALALQNERRYLLMSGNQNVVAYDPASGNQLWSIAATTYATCGTMVWDEKLGLAFASGGYPDTFTVAVRTRGDYGVEWRNNRLKCYEQSMLVVDKHLYLVTDSGVAYCLNAADGQERWKQRLGGKFSSSPLAIDGKIYVTNQSGTTYVFTASPAGFESLGKNQLGTECFATPTPVGKLLYHRFAVGSGEQRQEYLAAIGP